MKIRIHDIIIKLIFLIPLTTLFSQFSVVSSINRTISAVISLCLLYVIICRKDKKTIAVVVFTVVIYIYALLQTVWPIQNINEVIYLMFWLLLLNDVSSNYSCYVSEIKNNVKLIKGITIIWSIFAFVSIFIKSCYVNYYFCSFAGSQHRFSSSALQIIAMIMLYVKITNKKWYAILSLVPVFTVMLSGARTYMILVGIAAACLFYYVVKNKYVFYLTIIPIILIAVYYISTSSVMEYRADESSRLTEYYGGDSLRAFTSGRSVWWEIDMKYFFESPILNQFFGNGFHFIRYVNTVYYGQNIWAHNDFIQLLGTNGYVGLVLYLYSYLRLSKSVRDKKKEKRRLLIIGFHAMNFLNAFLNMLYTYFCATLSVPLFLVAFFDDESFTQEQKKDEINQSSLVGKQTHRANV